MNKYISINRLQMLFRHDITTYLREKIYLIALVFVPTLLAYFISDNLIGLTIVLLLISFFTAALAPYYMASHICANMRTKQGAIQFAMLPATNIEKFIVRFTNYAVLPTLIVFVSLVALGMVTGSLYSIGHFDEIKYNLRIMINDEQFLEVWEYLRTNIFTFRVLSLLFFIFVSYAFNISIVVLGGCYFKRFALIKTWLITLLASTIFGQIAILPDIEILNFDIDDINKIWINVCVIMSISVVMLFVAYKLFKRKQII